MNSDNVMLELIDRTIENLGMIIKYAEWEYDIGISAVLEAAVGALKKLKKEMTKADSWIFTFGTADYYGDYSGKAVRVAGSFDQARQKMFARFGQKWCNQYSEKEWEEMKKTLPVLEEIVEEIE